MTDAPAPDTGLSVEAATAILDGPAKPAKPAAAQAASTDQDQVDDQDQEQDQSDVGDEAGGDDEHEEEPDTSLADDGEEGDEDEPQEAAAIDPPASWDAEAKADFAQLPPALQHKLVAREQQRETAINTALERAAHAQKHAATVTQLGQAITEMVPRAVAAFGSKWDNVDWKALIADDPMEYVRLKAEHDDEQGQLQQLRAAQQVAEAESFAHFQTVREQELQTLAPDLCDPKEGNKRRTELSGYLVNLGIDPENIKRADAKMLAVANKAFLYDQARAARGGKAPIPQPAAARPSGPQSLRPAGAQGGSSRSRTATVAQQRFAKTGSIDDAVAVLNSR